MSRNVSLQSLLEQLKLSQRINLSDMYIGDDGARQLAQYVRNNKNLKYLELRGNNITSQGIIELLQACKACPLLRLISLEWNQIGVNPAGVEALANFLTNNQSLQHLGLQNNKIQGEDIEPLFNVLRTNNSLLSLDLKWNELGTQTGAVILDALKENQGLLYLELGGCEISQHQIEEIEEILEGHRLNNPIQKHKILQVEDQQQEQPLQEQQQPNPNVPPSQLIHHLEQVLEQERLHSLQIKQRMERELDELARRDKSDTRLLEELDARSRELESDNRSMRYNVEKLRDEYTLIERQQDESLRLLEDKIRSNEYILTELEKKHRTNLDRVLNENNFRVRDLIRDWENRCRAVDERARILDNENKMLEEELRQLGERQVQLKISYDQELRDLGRRVEEEEYQKFNSISQTLDAKIRAMEEAREVMIRRNADLAREYDQREAQGKNELTQLFDELERLKQDNNIFSQRNQEYKVECQRVKQDASLKETAVEKYEKEINMLNEQIELKRKIQRDQLAALLKDQKMDKGLWEVQYNFLKVIQQDERHKQHSRVQELEKTLRESHKENARLRQEYQRLSELIQFNVQKALHQTFTDNAYF